MNRRLTLGILCLMLSLSLMPGVSALTQSENLKMSMYPMDGDSDTKIIMFVSAMPLRSSGPWYLYVYWGETCIINGQADVLYSGTTYTHRWKIQFNPPHGKSGNRYNVHVVVLADTGSILERWTQFRLTESIPELSWFDDLTKAQIGAITGPAGPRGLKGVQGDKGLRGLKGEPGAVGATGVTGPAGLQGEQGSRGTIGPDGPPGEPGKEASMLFVYGALGLSIFNTILIFFLISRGGKGR